MAKNECRDTYKEVRTFVSDNAIIRVHIPDLTPEERARRMKLVMEAAARLLMAEEKVMKEKENGGHSYNNA